MPVLLSSLLLPSLLGCGMMEAQAKAGTKAFLFAPGEQVVVTVNGEDPATLDTYVGLSLGPGVHTIAVEGGPQVSVTLEPFDELVVPLVEDQCFMSLNVSISKYGSGQSAPKFAGRMQRSAPFALPKGHYHSEAALPDSITSGQQVFLLRSTLCYVVDDLEFGTTGRVTREDGSVDAVAGALALVRRASCPSNGEDPGAWCTALQGWNDGVASPLPKAAQAFLGQSVRADTGPVGPERAPDNTLFAAPLPLSILSLNGSGPVGELSSVAAENEKETEELDSVAQAVGDRLKARSEVLSVTAGMAGHLEGQASGAALPLTPIGPGWRLNGAEVRRVGEFWVSVAPYSEGGGHLVSVHTAYAQLPN